MPDLSNVDKTCFETFYLADWMAYLEWHSYP